MPPQECTANCTRSKPDSLRAPTRSLPAQASMVDDVWELSQRDRGGESIFLPNSLSQVHLRRQSKQAHPYLSDVRPSVPLLPRRGGVSFRAGEPTVLFREKVDGVKLCLVVGRKDDHDGSARRDTAIAPPRQICGCSDSISRREIKEGTRWCFLLTAIIFLQNGLVGRAPFIFLSSRSGSSDINPDCRRMQSLSRPKKPDCTAAGKAEKCQINNLNSESRCPKSRRRTRTKRAKPPRARRPHLWRRNPISSTSSFAFSLFLGGCFRYK